jgi:D,D-heptose 1,7-bisphosphate phosphatase
MITQAVILCGGFGKRMGELTKNTPKPMLPVDGVPLLERTVLQLRDVGITRIIFSLQYKASVIQDYFGNGEKFGVEIISVVEEEPLGTAGALRMLADKLDDAFLLIFGDMFMDFNLTSFMNAHAFGRIGTVLIARSDHPWDADILEIEHGIVKAIHGKHEPGKRYVNYANEATYVLDKKIIKYIPEGFSDLGKTVLPKVIEQEHVGTHELKWPDYILDCGTPERLAQAEKYLLRKKQKQELIRKPIKTVFIDRDGVLNKDTHHPHKPEHISLIPGSAQGLRMLNDAKLKTVLVTNQGVVALGMCDEDGLAAIHRKLQDDLAREGAKLDHIYYCPHRPNEYVGGVQDYNRACECRKPRPGMIFKAAEDHDIDLGAAVMVGDSTDDILAGQSAGVRTVLVQSGNGRIDNRATPDYVAEDFHEAAQMILRGDIQ